MNRRLTVAFVCLMGFFALVAGRLVQLQIVEADQWRELAKRFQEGTITIPAPRGRIYDRNGVLLAQDVRAISVALDNYTMTRPDVLEELLVKHLEIPRATAREKLYRPSYFTWIARAIPPERAEALEKAARAAGARGLIFFEDRARQYPHGDLASNVIGFTGVDGHGLEGIELFFDAELHGTESVWSFVRMADGTQIERRQIQPGQAGRDLTLTLDSRIQYIAESAITRGVRTYRAKAGIALVLDPWTGEVLAMAQDKRYDLNHFQASRPEQRQNLAVVWPFEPGSSFKIFTMLAALEHNVVALDERLSGSATYQIANHTFRNADGKEYGMVTPKDVIRNSINTAMIRIAQRIGEARLYEALRKYGFGQKTGIELPGEVPGYLPPVESWSALEIGSIAIGQSISVTAVQLASRVAMIAAGGKRIRPTIVKALTPMSLSRSSGRESDGEGFMVSPLSCQRLTEMMVETVRSGTGVLAQIAGYSIAAKTGTAQKALPGQGYVKGKYVASFEGFFPAEAPKYLILVVLDEPGGREYYGSETAAPIFKEIAQQLIALDRIPPRP
uniref:Cell division protein FtsI n=2 Tax=Candidatus Bipolaricaulota TaxID=67810 RepID=H5SFA9_9BACT|nr:cell division protein FtsI [uncultured Acetothermia bacterium]BAL58575.1 cell division protein FtsI [Candidatus Acetothermum autotrophicum]